MNYEKIHEAGGDYYILEVQPSGLRRQIGEEQSDYVAWLAQGNVPVEMPYNPHALPLETYKDQAENRLIMKSKARIANIQVERIPGLGVLETLNADVQQSMMAKHSQLSGKRQLGTITPGETALLNYYDGVYVKVEAIQKIELAARAAVRGCSDHACVDIVMANIEWPEV